MEKKQCQPFACIAFIFWVHVLASLHTQTATSCWPRSRAHLVHAWIPCVPDVDRVWANTVAVWVAEGMFY